MIASVPSEFTQRLAAITAQSEADKRAGGPWRVYLPRPGSSRLWLHWSFATEAAARERLAGMYPAIRRRAEVRHEA